jgi:1-acyl-sn-glycerol-3-phosphate acyltransferase
MNWLFGFALLTIFVLAHLYIYRLPRSVWSALLSLYYRNIHFIGSRPEESDIATIIVSNHPNAFIDPFALQVALKHPLVRTVRADWLQHWLVKWLIKMIGAVPLARFKKDKGQPNRSSFRQLHKALDEGKWIVVFPEGVSHNRSRLKDFKKGTAHIAKHYMTTTGKPIRVIQVALHYSDKSKLNSNIWVQTAKETVYTPDKSLNIAEQSAIWRGNIQAALPQMMRKAESAQLDWLNQSLCDLKQTPDELSATIEHCRHNSQLAQMQSWLKVTGLDLSVLQRHSTQPSMILRLLSESLVVIGGLPIAIFGIATHSLIVGVHYLLTKYHSSAADKWASNSFVIGIPLYSVFWFALLIAGGPLLALSTIFAGIYSLKYCQNWEARKKALFTSFSSLSKPHSRELVLDLAQKTLFPFSLIIEG